MKKFIVSLITIIAILLIIVLFKRVTTTTKYSNEDVNNLILKGLENMNNMENVSFEKEVSSSAGKYYYKGNKIKLLFLKGASTSSSIIMDLDEGKTYGIIEKSKNIAILNPGFSLIDKGIQYELARYINNNSNNERKYEYKYIKDEPLEGKDCILVKEEIFTLKNGEYVNISESIPEKELRVFWIEKSTGFVLGGTYIKPDADTATPTMIIRNISLGNVVDSDFDLPTDYEIIEND